MTVPAGPASAAPRRHPGETTARVLITPVFAVWLRLPDRAHTWIGEVLVPLAERALGRPRP